MAQEIDVIIDTGNPKDISVGLVGGGSQNIPTELEKVVDYEKTKNKPRINGVELVGNKTTEDLGIDVDTSDIESAINDIQSIIPETASADNKLADERFVNLALQTNTAYFRGDWATWADVPNDSSLYPADVHGNRTPTANDYMIVVADELQNGGTWRYKYTGLWSEQGKDGWNAEYQINETPFTVEQLEALNSGITKQDVEKIGSLQSELSAKVDSTELSYSLINGNPTISGSNAEISLQDRAITTVTVDDTVSLLTFIFPQKINGKARDFFVRLVIIGESIPTLSFIEANGDSVPFDVDDDSWAEIEQGVNILMFTDTGE